MGQLAYNAQPRGLGGAYAGAALQLLTVGGEQVGQTAEVGE
jgi:hypothetical protein